jgi:hypothetical protein
VGAHPRVFCEGGRDAVCSTDFEADKQAILHAASYPPFEKNAKDGAPALLEREEKTKNCAAAVRGPVARAAFFKKQLVR